MEKVDILSLVLGIILELQLLSYLFTATLLEWV